MATVDPYVALGPLGKDDYQKLLVNAQGELITTATGTFSFSGLKDSFRITTMDVTDSATLLPAVALTNRNALSIANLSGADTLYIGKNTVTADRVTGTTSGWEIGPNENMNLDITDDIVIYGIAEAGKTIQIKIFEIA